MSIKITFDMSQFKKAIQQSPQAVDKGIRAGLIDVKNDWVAEAVDIAPIDTGNLRKQIHGTIEDKILEVRVPAVRGGFNYAYYIHEDKGVVHSGEKKFLDVSAQKNEAKWAEWLKREINAELKRVGW